MSQPVLFSDNCWKVLPASSQGLPPRSFRLLPSGCPAGSQISCRPAGPPGQQPSWALARPSPHGPLAHRPPASPQGHLLGCARMFASRGNSRNLHWSIDRSPVSLVAPHPQPLPARGHPGPSKPLTHGFETRVKRFLNLVVTVVGKRPAPQGALGLTPRPPALSAGKGWAWAGAGNT